MKWKPERQKQPRKFREGRPFKRLQEFVRWTTAGGWVYWIGQRPKHPSILLSQQFRIVINAIDRRTIRRAIPNPAYEGRCPF